MSGLSLSDLPSSRAADRRAEQRQRRDRRRRRRRRTALVLVICLVVFGGGAFAVYSFARPVIAGFMESDDYEGPGTGSVQVQIQAGDSGRAIGNTLAKADVVKTSDAFVRATSDEPKAASLQPGTYELKKQMAAADALALLLDPESRISVRVTVPEGLRASQVFERLEEGTGIAASEFERAAKDPAVGLPPESGGDPEGYLFPATYEFEPDVGAVEILTTMVERHKAAMDAVGVPQDQRRTVLIKASLIEDEAQRPEDFGKVARVIENRLAKGMALQLDSTVNFATGKTGITTTDADRATDSPYNTYKYPGLPPGPVSSPGEAALEAALHPTPGDWLYFVAVNPESGETKYATTPEEHQRNVEEFRAWMREHGG
jgi:UPF0755 protein